MLVLIDESGDPGFRMAQGSTSHFVVAMVIFDDFNDAERTSAAVGALRTELRVKPEFKFTKVSHQVKARFFEEIPRFPFRVRAIIVDKSAVQSPELRTKTESFYNFFLRQLLQNDGGAIQGANIKVDGSGDAVFRKELTAYLRRQLREGQIAKFTFVDSRRDNLIQLADMCAGAINRAHRNDLRRDQSWYQALGRSGRVDDLWHFR